MKAVMLLLAFTIFSPAGNEMEETIHVYSKHFDTMKECKTFISDWESIIRSRGIDKVQELLKVGYKIHLDDISCAIPGSLKKGKPEPKNIEEDNQQR